MGLLEDLGSLLGGTPEERTLAREQGVGGVIASAPRNLAAGTQIAAGFGRVGDVGSYIGMATGSDPLTNTEQTKTTRGISIASLFGFGAAAAAMGVVVGNTSKMRRALDMAMEERSRAAQVLDLFPAADSKPIADRIATLVMKGDSIVPSGATSSVLGGVNMPAEAWDLESVFGLFNYTDTAGFLRQMSPDGSGSNSVARTILRMADAAPAGPPSPFTTTSVSSFDPRILYVNGFVEGLGERLIYTPHWSGLTSTLTGERLLEAKRHVAAFELSRWASSVARDADRPSTKPFLAGNRFKVAKKAWEDLRSGKQLSPEAGEELANAITMHAAATWWNDSPELTGSPRAKLSFINIDPGEDATLGVEYSDFDAVPLDRLTKKEAQVRLSVLFQTDPTAMVPILTGNLVRFTKNHVGPDTIQWWHNWYPVAYRMTSEAAAEAGMDVQRFIVLTSIMSPSQPWEENVAKAKTFAARWRELQAGGFGGDSELMWQQLTKAKKAGGDGLLLPRQTSMLAEVVMHADDPWVYFTDGLPTSTGALSIAEMHARMRAGERADDLLRLRANPGNRQLKTPSFAAAIANSSDEELRQQASYMARLMRDGLFRNTNNDSVLEALRLRVPVVVDRQATKVAIGFSLEPGSELSGQPGMFDAIAQAYRNASIELGPMQIGDEYRFLLPEELQAITWIQYRIMGHVKFSGDELPAGYPVPRTMNTPANPKRGAVGWRPGELRPTVGTKAAAWAEGAGPTLITDRSVLDLITGAADGLPFLGYDAIDYATDTSRYWNDPDTWFPAPSPTVAKSTKGDNWRKVNVHVAPDGSMKLLTDGWGPRLNGALLGRSPVLGKFDFDEGTLQALTPNEPVLVGDTSALYRTLQDSTRQVDNPELAGAVGSSYHPEGAPQVWREGGHHLLLSTEAAKADAPQFGVGAVRQLEAELRSQGINASVELQPSYEGWTNPPMLTADELVTGELVHVTSQGAAEAIARQGFALGQSDGIGASAYGPAVYLGDFGTPMQERMTNEWRSLHDGEPAVVPVALKPGTRLFDADRLYNANGKLSSVGKVWADAGLTYIPGAERDGRLLRQAVEQAGFDGIVVPSGTVVFNPDNVTVKRAWEPTEGRLGAVFSFQSNDDMQRAVEYLARVGDANPPVARGMGTIGPSPDVTYEAALGYEHWMSTFENSSGIREAMVRRLGLGREGGPFVMPFNEYSAAAGGFMGQRFEAWDLSGAALLRYIRDAQPMQVPLYRGLSVDADSPLLALRPGAQIDVPIMATTPSPRMASDFAQHMATTSGAPGVDVAVKVTIEGKVKAYGSEELVSVGYDDADPDLALEYVTSGRFAVMKAERTNNLFEIVLRQVDVFDPDNVDNVRPISTQLDTGVPNYRRIFKEDALDARAYTSGDVSAPKGWVALYEHHFTDPQGRELVVLNPEGDQWASNTRKVWVHPELAGFVQPTFTSALRSGGPLHRIEPWASIVQDDLMRVIERPATGKADVLADSRNPLQRYRVMRRATPDAKWGKPTAPESMAVGFDEQGMAHVAFDADTLPNVPAERTYVVRLGEEPEFDTKKSKKLGRPVLKRDEDGKQVWHKAVVIEPYRNAEGKADAVYGRKVVELLKRIGFGEMPTTKNWNRSDFA